MDKINQLRARNLAVEFVTDCIGTEEADGYQQYDEAAWYDHGPTVSEGTASGFVVTIGGHRIKFQATIERQQPARP